MSKFLELANSVAYDHRVTEVVFINLDDIARVWVTNPDRHDEQIDVYLRNNNGHFIIRRSNEHQKDTVKILKEWLASSKLGSAKDLYDTK